MADDENREADQLVQLGKGVGVPSHDTAIVPDTNSPAAQTGNEGGADVVGTAVQFSTSAGLSVQGATATAIAASLAPDAGIGLRSAPTIARAGGLASQMTAGPGFSGAVEESISAQDRLDNSVVRGPDVIAQINEAVAGLREIMERVEPLARALDAERLRYVQQQAHGGIGHNNPPEELPALSIATIAEGKMALETISEEINARRPIGAKAYLLAKMVLSRVLEAILDACRWIASGTVGNAAFALFMGTTEWNSIVLRARHWIEIILRLV